MKHVSMLRARSTMRTTSAVMLFAASAANPDCYFFKGRKSAKSGGGCAVPLLLHTPRNYHDKYRHVYFHSHWELFFSCSCWHWNNPSGPNKYICYMDYIVLAWLDHGARKWERNNWKKGRMPFHGRPKSLCYASHMRQRPAGKETEHVTYITSSRYTFFPFQWSFLLFCTFPL